MSRPSGPDFSSCAVCGRTILPGETVHEYVDPDAAPVGVCALCKPRAEAHDWIPAALAGTLVRNDGRRRRGRLRLGERFASLRARVDGGEAKDAESEPRASDPAGTDIEAPEAAPQQAEAQAPATAAAPPDPLERFNASEAARLVAGLRRSLGEPRATLRETGGATLVTVAWELSWYQWRVEGERVSEVAKGRELRELAAEDRAWNASIAEDGRLRRD